MKPLAIGALIVGGWLLLGRTGLGLQLGNRARAWSDRAMLTFLRLSSEFEREARAA
jgi:hypothetical protein